MFIGIDGNEANIKKRVGVNVYSFQLLHTLHQLQEAKKHKWIIYLKKSPLPDMPKPCSHWHYRILPGESFWILRRLTPVLYKNRDKLDIFFTPTHYLPPFSSVPMVMSVMDLGYLSFPNQFRKRDFFQLKYWTWFSMRKAVKIIAISNSTKNDICANYPWACKKTEVVYPGYSKNRVHTTRQANLLRKKFGIDSDYILFLGTFKPNKNLSGVLDAFSLLIKQRRYSRLQLVIAGKRGWLYEGIDERIKSLQKSVRLLGFVNENDKKLLFAGAEALVSPSFWEGFGLHVLEAMGFGVPVVVSKAGALPEVVGNAGIYVNPADPLSIAKGIRYAIEHRRLIKRRELKQVKKFDWGNSARKLLKIFQASSR